MIKRVESFLEPHHRDRDPLVIYANYHNGKVKIVQHEWGLTV
jgi:hypothetical protein